MPSNYLRTTPDTGAIAYVRQMDAWSRRRWAVDAALAAGFLAIGQYELRELPESGYHAGSLTLNTVITALGAAPLVMRRWRPSLALTLACLPHLLVSLVTPHTLGFWGTAVPVGILCYAAGRWVGDGAHGRLALAFPALLFASYGFRVPEIRHVEDFVVGILLWFVPWLAGRTIARLVAKERALRGALAALQEQEADRARHVVLEERHRIAREMHDVMAHGVSVMVIQAGAARLELAPDSAAARESLLAVEAIGRDVLDELRRTVGLLRDDEAELAAPTRTIADLADLAESMRTAGLTVSLDVDERLELDPGRSLAAYRVVQEALTNSLRHAGRSNVSVRIGQSDETGDDVCVDIVDSGTRIARPTGLSGGHGLIGATERVAMYGGTLEAVTEGSGFAVHARIPREVSR